MRFAIRTLCLLTHAAPAARQAERAAAQEEMERQQAAAARHAAALEARAERLEEQACCIAGNVFRPAARFLALLCSWLANSCFRALRAGWASWAKGIYPTAGPDVFQRAPVLSAPASIALKKKHKKGLHAGVQARGLAERDAALAARESEFEAQVRGGGLPLFSPPHGDTLTPCGWVEENRALFLPSHSRHVACVWSFFLGVPLLGCREHAGRGASLSA